MKSNIDLNTLKCDTIRVKSSKSGFSIRKSSNRGLECYLGEAYLLSKPIASVNKKILNASIKRVLNESQLLKNKCFWGWEKKPSIKEIYFPLDWDDTCKALDFLLLSKKLNLMSGSNLVLFKPPNEVIWENELKKSFFKSKSIGEDIRIKIKNSLSISVFLGRLSAQWNKREDPMVTVTLIRTTALWYPETFNKLYVEFDKLIKKQLLILNYLLENRINFSLVSRYYFSLGHFAYRLIESFQITNNNNKYLEPTIIKLKKELILVRNHLQNKPSLDDFWWFLIDLKLNLKILNTINFSNLLMSNNFGRQIIFRHRRLEHSYYSKYWTEKLLLFEYYRVMNNGVID